MTDELVELATQGVLEQAGLQLRRRLGSGTSRRRQTRPRHMVVSAMVNAHRDPATSAGYRRFINGRLLVIARVASFATVTEMLYGALKAGWGELRRRALEQTLSQLVVVQPDDDLLTVSAELRDRCERRGDALGQKIHETDRWIAASALHLGVELVSDDSVFQNIDGLTVLSRPST